MRNDSVNCASKTTENERQWPAEESPSRLRICRLMYKPLPQGSRKLDVRRHPRNRRLVLDKKRISRTAHASVARRAIPNYFQKRLKQRFLVRQSASTRKSASRAGAKQGARKEEVPSSLCISSAASVNGDNAGHLDTEDQLESKEVKNVTTTEGTTAEEPDTAESTSSDPAASPKAVAIDRADALSTIKEYWAIQNSIRLLLSMLQERMEEVESMPKKDSMATMKGSWEKSGSDTDHGDNLDADVQRSTVANGEVSTFVDKEQRSCDEYSLQNGTGDAEPNKENNVPSKGESETVFTLNRANSTPMNEESTEEARPYSFLATSKSDILDPTYTCDIELEPLENRKRSIVDSLLNKFNLSPPAKVVPPAFYDSSSPESSDASARRSLRDRTKIAARARYIETPEEPRKMRVSKVFGKLHKTLNIDLDCANSNSSTEFYGFDEGEVVKLDKPSLPGLLPTPIVKKSQPYAPFLAYGTSIDNEDASVGTETRSDLFREEGLIAFGSLPPRLECPQRPNDMVRPRTVAQKRILVQKENDVRYLIIDNESKIFQFLEKRSKNIDAELDFCRMKELQDQQIPFTRDTWRALAWLRTEKGRYYFQSVTVDNRTIKLTGCKGNHRLRNLTKNGLYSSPVIASRGHRYHYVSNCRCPEYPEGVALNLSHGVTAPQTLDLNNRNQPTKGSVDNKQDLNSSWSINDYRRQPYFPGTKPGPLSSKKIKFSPDDDPCLGPLEVFHMPPVELEVFPKINRPLDGHVKPYLKLILPHDGITENWARFAVSTLSAPKDEVDSENETTASERTGERSFVFQLPYENNQRRLLIRRRLTARPGSAATTVDIDVARFEKLMEEKMTFREKIDRALAHGSTDEYDKDELICADVISDLTNSVAIALAEDVFVADDPDIDYSKQDEKCRPYPEKITLPLKIETSAPGSRASSAAPSPALAVPTNVPTTDSGSATAGTHSEPGKMNAPVNSKLLREMKRLNATIIEGPSQPPVSPVEVCREQRCDPQYCARGCVCDVMYGSQALSLACASRIKHCRQSDCLFGCQCGYEQRAANHTEEVQMSNAEELRGGNKAALSSADVKYLREKATARLAKEEREFTPTVILTKNTTVLVRNTESETRRQTKKPKKYDDYYNDVSMQSFLNGGSVHVPSDYISKPPANAKPLTPAERIRHAHVVLNKLPLGDLEPLCMVHDLYRCYCGGKATQGKPFSFTEENCISISSKMLPATSNSLNSSAPSASAANSPSSGRMMKTNSTGTNWPSKNLGDGVVAKTNIETTLPVPGAASIRKRLYSFEKIYNDTFDNVSSDSGQAANRSSRESSQNVSHRRQRDSSEESYKPPSERRAAKKKPVGETKAAAPGVAPIRGRRASVAPVAVTIAARRASVAPGVTQIHARRASVAPGGAPIHARRASVAPGISNIIIKRISGQPSVREQPTQDTAPKVAKKQTMPDTAKVGLDQKASKPDSSPASSEQRTTMSVRELKQLIVNEHKNVPSTMHGDDASQRIVNIALVDTEENIDNEPQLNILTEGTKKLVINGNRRSFVENTEFREDIPPGWSIPFSNRTVYVVEIPGVNLATKTVVSDVTLQKNKKPASKALPVVPSPSSSAGTSAPLSQNVVNPPPVVPISAVQATEKKPAIIMRSVYDVVQQTDRQLVSLMRHINELMRRKTLSINPPKKGIMHICRWGLLLRAFALGDIDVLDLVLTNGLELTIVTTKPFQPLTIPNVKTKISARESTIDHMVSTVRPSLLMKMMVCQVENVKTNELALVLYGSEQFWHFCGFIKASEKLYGNDANVVTTPSVKSNQRIKARLKEYYRKTCATINTAGRSAISKTTPVPRQGAAEQQRSDTSTISPSTQSNIEIVRKGMQSFNFPIENLLRCEPSLAEMANEGCRWMRLKVENDFSHMYLPSWQCCVTSGRIKKTISDANRTGQPVRLQPPTPLDEQETPILPLVYALPKEGHSLFIGPYSCATEKIDIILCQSVQGKMYEREVYERLNGITATITKRTNGWWVDVTGLQPNAWHLKVPLTEFPQLSHANAQRVGPAIVTSTVQRSLLKRNNILPTSTATTAAQSVTAANPGYVQEVSDEKHHVQHKGKESSTASLLHTSNGETNVDLVNTLAKEVKELPTDVQNGEVDLYQLIQGTMRQNQQKKREIESMLQKQNNFTKFTNTDDGSEWNELQRKRKSTETAVKSTVGKIARFSDTVTIEMVKQAPPKQIKLTNGTETSNYSIEKKPSPPKACSSGIKPPNAVLKTVDKAVPATTAVCGVAKPNSVTRLVNPAAKMIGEKVIPMASVNPRRRLNSIAVERHSLPLASVSSAVKGTDEKVAHKAGVQPRRRLKSVAVERHSLPLASPTVSTDEVVCLDDDDDENEPTSSGEPQPPSSSDAPAIAHLLYKQNTVLTQEQASILATRLDLTKTGQQNGYSFNRTTGLLKLKRSLANSLGVNVEFASNADEISLSTVEATPPPAVAATPSANITLPRMKVVPRNVPSTVVKGEHASSTAQPNGTGVANGSTEAAGPDSITQLFNYLSDTQAEQLLKQPHTKGVLESKIPGLGLVEVMRLDRQVIILMRELTVKKQLVSVKNLEDAVTLLNQFIQRNTYTFKPFNLVIKWVFRERSTPLTSEEKLTKKINHYSVVTRYGIINLSKADDLQQIEETLPALYEELMKVKLAMLCFNKQRFDAEKIYENDDMIYNRCTDIIDELQKESKWLQQQQKSHVLLLKRNKERLKQLKPSTQTDESAASATKIQETVIIIDDD
ncbi:uncharacterized protein LOC128728321 [Anopheles nili]|uniref:uncharacterized protein LOC128728321 n=1 Tax=Anopheles nili TaxID=185578 RepID=UPI00237B4245|nr:uncharacterized protein LOC128728321 [Anopheles nili]